MPIDPNIIAGIKPVNFQQPDPMEQYGKSLTLKNLMLQNTMAEQGAQDEEAQRAALIESAGDNKRYRELLAGRGQHKAVQALDKFNLETDAKRASLKHTEAQTDEITAGRIAGSLATLARSGGSDDAVRETSAQLAPIIGQQAADVRAQKLLSMPPEQRVAFAVAQAGQHKVGQEALKIFYPQAHMQDNGSQVVPVSTSTLPGGPAAGTQIPGSTPLAKTQTPDSVAVDARARETLAETRRHHQAIEGDPATIESTAQAIAKGELAPLTSFALARPMGQQIMSRVAAIHQEKGTQFDPTQFATRQKAERDFATGKQGNSVRSFNVALSHLDTLEQLTDALNNKDTRLINQIANVYKTQAGASSAPTNFEAAKQIVGDEIVKAIIGAGGGVSDREKAQEQLNRANSPQLLKGVINTYKELMRGQIGGLRDQYKATTGKDDFDTKYLSDAGRKASHGAAPAKPAGSVNPASLSDAELKRELGL